MVEQRLIIVGGVNYDTVATVARLPRRHEKVLASHLRDCLGGSAANTAAWSARCGANTTIVGTVGRDPAGDACLAWLRSASVNCDHVAATGGRATGRALCLATTRDKRIVVSPGPPPAGTWVESVRQIAPRIGDLVHVAAGESPEVVKLARESHQLGATISVELNGRSMADVRAVATIAFINHDDLYRVFGVDWKALTPRNLKEFLVLPSAVLVVTLGSRGAMCLSSESIVAAKAHRVKVVDRTGAGDAFNGGFLEAYSRSRGDTSSSDLDTCLSSGLRVAAEVLGYVGAHP